MRTWRATTIVVLLGALAAGGLAAGGWLQAEAQDDGCTALTGADIAEIEQLYARYNQGLDFKDVDLYLSAYADDGVFHGLERHAGQAALRAYLETVWANDARANRTHNSTSILLAATPEGAKGRGYFSVIDVTSRPPAIAGHGYFDDTFVRTDDGWRIETRTLGEPWPYLARPHAGPGGDWLADACG